MEWRAHQFYVIDCPLGLNGTLTIGRLLSEDSCYFWQPTLSNCQLTTILGSNDDSIEYINTFSDEMVVYVGQKLCKMPQSHTVSQLNLCGNSFTGMGIHILAGFMHLCPQLVRLYCDSCEITTGDLEFLLSRLTELKHESSDVCKDLTSWSLKSNRIDDGGVSSLLEHIPSIFSHFGMNEFGGIELENNLISECKMKIMTERMNELKQVSNYNIFGNIVYILHRCIWGNMHVVSYTH